MLITVVEMTRLFSTRYYIISGEGTAKHPDFIFENLTCGGKKWNTKTTNHTRKHMIIWSHRKRYLAIKSTNKSKLQKVRMRNLVTTIQKQNFSFTSSIFSDLENSWNNQLLSTPSEMKGKKPTLSTSSSLYSEIEFSVSQKETLWTKKMSAGVTEVRTAWIT